MGNVEKFIIFFCISSLLFYYTGLIPQNGLVGFLLAPQDVAQSELYVKLVLGITSIAGIVIGFLARDVVAGIMASIVTFLASFLLDYLAVYDKIYQVNPFIAVFIYGLISVLWLITLVKFWQGTD